MLLREDVERHVECHDISKNRHMVARLQNDAANLAHDVNALDSVNQSESHSRADLDGVRPEKYVPARNTPCERLVRRVEYGSTRY